ncbi:hypothetical protein V8C35DRAFT_311909, partial [Trichoderma chlorosporum]
MKQRQRLCCFRHGSTFHILSKLGMCMLLSSVSFALSLSRIVPYAFLKSIFGLSIMLPHALIYNALLSPTPKRFSCTYPYSKVGMLKKVTSAF